MNAHINRVLAALLALFPASDLAVALDRMAEHDGHFSSRDGARYSDFGRVNDILERVEASLYAVRLVEDPCAEDDRAHYAEFRAAVDASIVGDDLVVTDAARIRSAAGEGLIDAALIKPNQSGTVSGARAALDACRQHGILPIVSARSGETEDASIVHLAVGWQAPLLKVGSITRGERTAKWNEGIRIAEHLRSGGAIKPLPSRH